MNLIFNTKKYTGIALNDSYYKLIILLLFSLFITGCKKFVDVPPPSNQLANSNVFKNDATAIAVLTGIYQSLSMSTFSTNSANVATVQFYTGLSSDELVLWDGFTNYEYSAYYSNSLAVTTNTKFGSEFWTSAYAMIQQCNSAIENLKASGSLTAATKQELIGEATFLRALNYFYLVNLYGDVPLVLTSDYKTNQSASRTEKNLVYQQIITDLKISKNLLSSNYLNGTISGSSTERERPNKWVAMALLARTYLYYGNLTNNKSNYDDAYLESDSLINNSSLFSLSSLNNTFLKYSLGNKEAIWQLQPVGNVITNTEDAYDFIIPPTGPGTPQPFYLNDHLLNSFESGDQRKANWISSVTVNGTVYYYPFKYKVNALFAPVTEYLMMFRLGEQYLIRAEAEAYGSGSGNAGATRDLNLIRNRAGLTNYQSTDQASLINAIEHERQVEMFTEGGHRWLDLKRTKQIDAIMSAVTPQKGGVWHSYQQLYPIADIFTDPNIKQNPGY